MKVGVSLIFQLLNMSDYIDYTEFHKGSFFYAPIYLSGLSVSGKIILPLMKTEADVRRKRDESINRDQMIAAAREGDQEAIESLTLEDIDMYATISRPGLKRKCFNDCGILFYCPMVLPVINIPLWGIFWE